MLYKQKFSYSDNIIKSYNNMQSSNRRSQLNNSVHCILQWLRIKVHWCPFNCVKGWCYMSGWNGMSWPVEHGEQKGNSKWGDRSLCIQMYRQRGRTLRKKFHKQVALSFGNGLDVEQKKWKSWREWSQDFTAYSKFCIIILYMKKKQKKSLTVL